MNLINTLSIKDPPIVVASKSIQIIVIYYFKALFPIIEKDDVFTIINNKLVFENHFSHC